MSRFMAALEKNNTGHKAPPPAAKPPTETELGKMRASLLTLRAELPRAEAKLDLFRTDCTEEGLEWREAYINKKTGQFVHEHWTGQGSYQRNADWKKHQTHIADLTDKIESLEVKLGLSAGTQRVFKGRRADQTKQRTMWQRLRVEEANAFYQEQLATAFAGAHEAQLGNFAYRNYVQAAQDALVAEQDAKAQSTPELLIQRRIEPRHPPSDPQHSPYDTVTRCTHSTLVVHGGGFSSRKEVPCDCTPSYFSSSPLVNKQKHPRAMVIGPNPPEVDPSQTFSRGVAAGVSLLQIPRFKVGETIDSYLYGSVRIIGVHHDGSGTWRYVTLIQRYRFFSDLAESDLV